MASNQKPGNFGKTDKQRKYHQHRRQNKNESEHVGEGKKNVSKQYSTRPKVKFSPVTTKPKQEPKDKEKLFKPKPGQQKKVNEAKLSTKLAEVLFNVLQERREDSTWNLSESPEESSDEDNISNVSPSIDRASCDFDDNYSQLSQLSMDCSLSQTLSQSSKSFKKTYEDYLKIGIFWDIENCPIPKGKSVLHLIQKIRNTFCEDFSEDKFIVVCNANNQPPTLAKDLSDLMVRIEHVSPSKNAADEILRRNIREFAENKTPGTKVVLITGDINFNSEVHEMRYKRHFKVVLIHNRQTSESLRICANECILFEDFACDIPNKNISVIQEIPVSVTITNLPRVNDVKKLKGAINSMINSFGGKSSDIDINKREMLVYFSSECTANRAISSLNNQILFGSKIKLMITRDRRQQEFTHSEGNFEGKKVLKTANLSSEKNLEDVKTKCLQQHEVKCEILKKKLDDSLGKNNKEFKSLYCKFRLLENMKIEFLKNYQNIIKIQNKSEAQKKLLLQCENLTKALPIYAYRSQIIDSVSTNSIVIISAHPGSGKSTQVVQYLMETLENDKYIVCTQPHKTLVTLVANKVTEQSQGLLKCDKILFLTDHFLLSLIRSDEIFFVTDHFLLNECFNNKSLDEYSHLIIDEVQMFTPATEVLLGYLKLLLQRGSQLKVIILTTSGTSNCLSKYFNNACTIEIDTNMDVDEKIEMKTTLENYIKDCTSKAIELVSSDTLCNVLMYLPNVYDINLAADLLTIQFKNNPNVTVSKLLLEQNFLEEYEIIEKGNNCCIVLTTHEIATTVSIRNLKHVIDVGLVSIVDERAFYRCVETIQVDNCKKTNNSCLLHFFKIIDASVDKSIDNNLTKILSVYGLDIVDPFKFQFIHPVKDFQSCLKVLDNIKAIGRNQITEKGKLMLALPFDIHLANLLAEGIHSHIGYVVICFCAVALSVKYCNNSSFTATNGKNLFHLLKEYFNKNVNLQIMTYENEIINLLKSKMNVEKLINKIPIDWEINLKKLLISCWEANLCELVKQKQLYKCVSTGKTVNLLPYTNSRPQIIMFETLWKSCSTDYIATYIPIEYQEEKTCIENCSITVRPIGHYIMRSVLVGSNGKLKSEWEKQLSDVCKSQVHINHNAFKGELKVYGNRENMQLIQKEVEKVISEAQEKLTDQLWEYVICPESGMKIMWGKSAKVLQFLLPTDFLTVAVFAQSSDIVLQQFRRYGKIIHHTTKPRTKENPAVQTFLIFNNPTSARHAMTNRDRRFRVKAVKKEFNPDKLPSPAKLKVTWTRRFNNGMAIVNFDKIVTAELIQERLINDRRNTCFAFCDVVMELSDKRILLKKLDRTVTRNQLEIEIKRKIDCVSTIHVPQDKIFASDAKSIEDIERKLMDLLSKVLGKDLDVVIQRPQDKDELWSANVTVHNQISQRSIESLKKLTLDGCQLCISQTNFCHLLFSEELFSNFKASFLQEMQKYLDRKIPKTHVLMTADTASNGRTVVKLEADELDSVITAYQILNTKIQSVHIDLSKYDFQNQFDDLLEDLAAISRKRNAYINYKKYANKIVIVGKEEALNDVQRYFTLKDKILKVKPMGQYNCQKPKGMLYELFESYGSDLKKLQKAIGAYHLTLDVSVKDIKVFGGKEEEIKVILDFIKSTVLKVPAKKSSICCPICSGNPLEREKHFRLEYCGHDYCSPCIGALIAFSKFPVCCIAQGCEAPIVYRDLKALQTIHGNLLENLANRATIDYIEENKRNLFFCPMPDCDGVYPRSDHIQQCLKCFNLLCLKCDVMYHYGQTCNEFQSKRQVNSIQIIKSSNVIKEDKLKTNNYLMTRSIKSPETSEINNSQQNPVKAIKSPVDITGVPLQTCFNMEIKPIIFTPQPLKSEVQPNSIPKASIPKAVSSVSIETKDNLSKSPERSKFSQPSLPVNDLSFKPVVAVESCLHHRTIKPIILPPPLKSEVHPDSLSNAVSSGRFGYDYGSVGSVDQTIAKPHSLALSKRLSITTFGKVSDESVKPKITETESVIVSKPKLDVNQIGNTDNQSPIGTLGKAECSTASIDLALMKTSDRLNKAYVYPYHTVTDQEKVAETAGIPHGSADLATGTCLSPKVDSVNGNSNVTPASQYSAASAVQSFGVSTSRNEFPYVPKTETKYPQYKYTSSRKEKDGCKIM